MASATRTDLIQEVNIIDEILRDPNFAWGVLGGSAFVGLLTRAVLAIRIREHGNDTDKSSAKNEG